MQKAIVVYYGPDDMTACSSATELWENSGLHCPGCGRRQVYALRATRDLEGRHICIGCGRGFNLPGGVYALEHPTDIRRFERLAVGTPLGSLDYEQLSQRFGAADVLPIPDLGATSDRAADELRLKDDSKKGRAIDTPF